MLDVLTQDLRQRLKDLRGQLLTVEISEEDKRIKKVCEEFGSNHFTKKEEAILKEIKDVEEKIWNQEGETPTQAVLERKGSRSNLIDNTFSKEEKEMDAAEHKESWLRNLYAEKSDVENALKETVKESEKKHIEKKLNSVKEKISEIETQKEASKDEKDLIENMADAIWTQNLSEDALIRWGGDANSSEKEQLPSLKERSKRLFDNLETASEILNLLERSQAQEDLCEYMKKQVDILKISAKSLNSHIESLVQERKEKINAYLSIPDFIIDETLAFSFCEYMKSEGAYFEKAAVNKKLFSFLEKLLSDLDDKEWFYFCRSFSINLWKKMQTKGFAEVQIGRKGGLNHHMVTLTKKGIDAAKVKFDFNLESFPIRLEHTPI